MIKRGALILLATLLPACAALQPSIPDTVEFAPELNVDLEMMEQLSSGVYIRDLRVGSGAPVRHGERVAVHFVGWLPDGTQIGGLAPPSDPFAFRLGIGDVIRGWEEGIPGMRVGGQRMIVVPPAHGYGASHTGDVPPNSVLVFVIDLVGRP